MEPFECVRCGECCRIEGQVRLGVADISRLAVFLRESEGGFIERYTRLAADRQGLALTDQPGGACIFLDSGRCQVNEVKPDQCRGFPSQWSNPGWERYCQGAQRLASPTGAGPEAAA